MFLCEFCGKLSDGRSCDCTEPDRKRIRMEAEKIVADILEEIIDRVAAGDHSERIDRILGGAVEIKHFKPNSTEGDMQLFLRKKRSAVKQFLEDWLKKTKAAKYYLCTHVKFYK